MTNHSRYYYDYTRNDPNKENPFTSENTVKADGYSVNGKSNNDLWTEDTFAIDLDPSSPYHSSMSSYSTDTITFDLTNKIAVNLDMPKNNKYKYSEDRILKELSDYISTTYNQHYSAGDDKIQTLDLIEACGDGESFCRSNILKYASRYDKKGTARRDIMKILHYAVLLMHFNDKNAQRETYPQ